MKKHEKSPYDAISERLRQRRDRIERKEKEGDSVLRDLFAVVTVVEASRRWRKHYSNVIKAMDHGKLNYRRSGSIWLIQASSLIKLWGQPVPPELDDIELVVPMWEK